MPRVNHGKWMLAIFVFASLITPALVAAGQEHAVPAAPALAAPAPVSSAAPIEVDFETAVEQEMAGRCFNRVCTTHTQCKTWCLDTTATCIENPATGRKNCFLP